MAKPVNPMRWTMHQGAEMWSADPPRTALPATSNGKGALPHARRGQG